MRRRLVPATTVIRLVTALFVLLLLPACTRPKANEPATADAPTRRQLDSALARSRLPGAPVVGRALDVVGQTEDRAAALDTIR